MSVQRLLTALVIAASVTIGLQAAILYRLSDQRLVVPLGQGTASTTIEVPSDMRIDLRRLPVKGDDTAKVAIVEFADYECPYCNRHAAGVLPELQDRFISKGTIRYAFADFPLEIHPSAQLLALAANCAAREQKYWEMHDSLFEARPRSETELTKLAASLGMDGAGFASCLETGTTEKRDIERNRQLAATLGFQGTPSFAIGSIDTEGRLVVRRLFSGMQSLAQFEKTIAEIQRAAAADSSRR